MIYHTHDSYNDILDSKYIYEDIYITDHLNGFDQNRRNPILDHLSDVGFPHQILINYALDQEILEHYKNLNLQFVFQKRAFEQLRDFNRPVARDFKSFVCSFNGSPHVSKQLLTSSIYKMGWFDPEYCSKNFSCDLNQVDGHLQTFLQNDEQERFYRKFIVDDFGQKFYNSTFSFDYQRTTHTQNILTLEPKLSGSFVHVVAETVGTTYYPFVTEKFIYSIITRGLFIAYAQPGWHKHIQELFDFKPYNKIFDYSFDQITNPIERLVALIEMLAKFEKLSRHDWHDLYLIEEPTIDHNYHNYVSGDYLAKVPEIVDITPKPLV